MGQRARFAYGVGFFAHEGQLLFSEGNIGNDVLGIFCKVKA